MGDVWRSRPATIEVLNGSAHPALDAGLRPARSRVDRGDALDCGCDGSDCLRSKKY
jgi:hypothetical protein